MISNQEEDEFVAVRVQDPRLQNEGSWNSYVDYKIFLHTNSKAFTAKTSCVRRRYSEFAWLKKKLQKNAGLVPVPELPGKSFFSFSNEDFLEKRRKGLQAFLDSVVNMTVCLSDSQLHLFLQTQLPVGHIQDCVQGHTPYSVTDAILTYASSNRGLAQAQEEDSIKEPSLTVSYESMESPAPHLPVEPKETFRPELLSCSDPDPLEGLLELSDSDTVEFLQQEKSSVRVLQKNNHLEVVEDRGPTEATFFLGDVPESLSLADDSQQRSCRIQAAVEVHSPMGSGFEEKCGVDRLFQECSAREESELRSATDGKTEEEVDQREKVDFQPEKCGNSAAILELMDNDARSQEEILEVVSSEKQIVENLTVSHPEEKSDQLERSRDVEVEKCVNSPENLDLKLSDFKEQVTESEEVLEVVCSVKQVLENHVIPEVQDLEHDTEEKTVPHPETEEKVEDRTEKVDLQREIPHLKDSEVKEQEEILEVVCSEKQVVENHAIPEVRCLEHDTEEKTVLHLETEEKVEESESSGEVRTEKVDLEQEIPHLKEQVTESDSESQEEVLEVIFSEKQIMENQEMTVPHPETQEKVEELESSGEVRTEKVDLEREIPLLEDSEVKEQVTESDSESQEEVLEAVCSEKQVLENHVTSEVNGEVEDVGCLEEFKSVPEEESSGEHAVQQMDQAEQEVVRTKDDSDDDSGSSSNESIVKVSDEESACEEEEEAASPAANGYMQTEQDVPRWPHVEASSRNILELHMNGRSADKEDDELQFITNISELSDSLDLNSAVTGADLTENSDISILEM